MKKVILKSSVIILLLTTAAYSQITIQIGGGLGATAPTGNYAGTTIDFYNGTHYGLGTGFNIHAKARVGLLGFNLFGMIDYSTLSSGEGEGEPGKGKVENSHNIFSLKAGPEFNISIPLFPLGFYLDGFISVNTISGTVKFQGLTKIPSSEYDIESATRFGVGAGGGVLLDILPVVTLDFGIHYNTYNLFGKQYTTNVTSHERLDAYTSLNDEKDPLFQPEDDDHIIGDSRSMNAWQFTLTALIGI
jgi:opacity protein-like surface antigen